MNLLTDYLKRQDVAEANMKKEREQRGRDEEMARQQFLHLHRIGQRIRRQAENSAENYSNDVTDGQMALALLMLGAGAGAGAAAAFLRPSK